MAMTPSTLSEQIWKQLQTVHPCRLLPSHDLPLSLKGEAEVWDRPRMWTAP